MIVQTLKLRMCWILSNLFAVILNVAAGISQGIVESVNKYPITWAFFLEMLRTLARSSYVVLIATLMCSDK